MNVLPGHHSILQDLSSSRFAFKHEHVCSQRRFLRLCIVPPSQLLEQSLHRLHILCLQSTKDKFREKKQVLPKSIANRSKGVRPMLNCVTNRKCCPPFVDILPIHRGVIYRTRSAGLNISQYIGSTRETWILIILVHSVATYNFQHKTLTYSALQFIPQQKRWRKEVYI